MSAASKTRIEHALDLEQVDVNLFRSEIKYHWKPIGGRAIFGGQVIGQALAAATRTVDAKMHVHSLHSYFVLAGNVDVPILYHVHRTRDGRSFATRSVRATQNGNTIFSCQASFHVPEEYCIEHQYPMPEAPDPESLPSQAQKYQEYLADPAMPAMGKAYIQKLMDEPVTTDMRSVRKEDWRFPQKVDPPHQMFWVKSIGALGDDLRMHQCVTAYCSDHRLLGTALLPYGIPPGTGGRIQIMASLDHSMWFHEPFRADEWLLYQMESPRMISNRGLSFGRIYSQDGRLVVSMAQEGLIRVIPEVDVPRTIAMKKSPTDTPKQQHAVKLIVTAPETPKLVKASSAIATVPATLPSKL